MLEGARCAPDVRHVLGGGGLGGRTSLSSQLESDRGFTSVPPRPTTLRKAIHLVACPKVSIRGLAGGFALTSDREVVTGGFGR